MTRAQLLLGLGAAAGLALAASSLLARPAGGALPDGAVAVVNGVPIQADAYRRAVLSLASDRREPVGAAERRRVLDRLIEEELLVQHALSLGLARHDRRVRADLVSAVLGSLVASSDGLEPSRRELARFYEEQRDYFTRPGRLRVRQVVIGPGTGEERAAERAREAARRLRAGEPFEAVRAALGDPEIAPVPDASLPPAKLRGYLGPSALHAALELAPGQWSDPVRTAQGHHVVGVLEREPPRLPPLEEIESQVAAELQRRAGDRAVRERLDSLRALGDVRVATELP